MGASAHDYLIAHLPGLLPRLWRFGLVLSHDRDMAEELVQMTCVRAIERARQFTPGTRLDCWLFAILRSVWLNELRSRRTRTGEGLDDPEEVLVVDGAREIEMNILAAQVFAEVMELPQAQRETVLLVYVEGFTYREAAELLGIPAGTVMSRLAAVRLKLGRLNAGEARSVNRPDEKIR
jgi:RNA polymerase sigma-70 factor (ECF subfamily)